MHPDEELLLDLHVRFPESLSREERQEAERLIETDAGAARFVEHLRDFYAFLEEEKARETPPQVERFVDELFDPEEEGPVESGEGRPGARPDRPPATTEVRPFEPRREAGPTVLAAATKTAGGNTDSEDTTSGTFQTYATLVSEGGEVLVRIIGNRESGRGRAYVLSGAPERSAWAMISIPELGLDLLSGEDGIAEFDLPQGVGPDRWTEATAVVRRPVAEASVRPGSEVALRPSAGDASTEQGLPPEEGSPPGHESRPDEGAVAPLRCRLDEGQLIAEQEGGQFSFLAGWSEGSEEPVLLDLRPQVVSCSVPPGEALRLRAYE